MDDKVMWKKNKKATSKENLIWKKKELTARKRECDLNSTEEKKTKNNSQTSRDMEVKERGGGTF